MSVGRGWTWSSKAACEGDAVLTLYWGQGEGSVRAGGVSQWARQALREESMACTQLRASFHRHCIGGIRKLVNTRKRQWILGFDH